MTGYCTKGRDANTVRYGTEALATRLAITLLILGTILCSLARPQEHSIGFYYVKTDRTDLATAVLDETPFLTDRDIISYDWATHSLVVTADGAARLPSWNQVPLSHKYFVVVADGVRCYCGAFINYASSLGFSGPSIFAPFAPSTYHVDGIQIQRGMSKYTNETGREHELPDLRESKGLRVSLRSLGKLKNELSDTTASVPFLVPDPPQVRQPMVARGNCIEFHLGTAEKVLVTDSDIGGRQVAIIEDRQFETGDHVVCWDGKRSDGSEAEPGAYLLEVESEEVKQGKRVAYPPLRGANPRVIER